MSERAEIISLQEAVARAIFANTVGHVRAAGGMKWADAPDDVRRVYRDNARSAFRVIYDCAHVATPLDVWREIEGVVHQQ